MFDSSKIKVWDAEEFSKLEIPDDHFIVQPRILPRGGRWLLGGATAIGKTFIALNVIRSFVSGEPLFANSEWKVTKAKVLMLENEVGLTMGERIRDVFKDIPAKFHLISQPEGFSLSYPESCKWLQGLIKEMGIEVLILDPFSTFHYADENANSQINMILEQLKIVTGPDCAAIITHHFGKPPKGQWAHTYNPLDKHNFRGASKMTDSVDALLVLDRKPGPLVATHKSWALSASWEKVRHARDINEGEDFKLHFNEHGDCRVLWKGVEIHEPLPTKEPKVPARTYGSLYS